jgi:hypothetical protein
MLHTLMIITFGLYLVIGVLWRAWGRSRDRRREAETTAKARAAARLAMARSAVRMPALHPEKPLPPGRYEAIWCGGDYEAWAGELADIDVNDTGGAT